MYTCKHEGARTEVKTPERAVAKVYKDHGWEVSPDPDAKEGEAPEKDAPKKEGGAAKPKR